MFAIKIADANGNQLTNATYNIMVFKVQPVSLKNKTRSKKSREPQLIGMNAICLKQTRRACFTTLSIAR
jgi:hypothetical protein